MSANLLKAFRSKGPIRAAALSAAFAAHAALLGASGPMDPLPKDDAVRIAHAVPTRAPAVPAKPRRLLIYTGNVNYGGHRSMAYAAEAFRVMGEVTGAFATEVADNPAVFAAESLRRFDAVFLNNNVGNLTEDPALRDSLLDFILGGGGLLGVHGTAVAFTRWPGAVEDWPEFGRIIGGRGANHRESDEHVFLKLDDSTHPLTAMFPPGGFDFRDEFFRVHEPYSRGRVRVLMSFDTAKTDMNQGPPRGDCVRADGDYAVAWIRGYGRGRVFYCTIAHNPYVFWDRPMLEFYLAALQFALGDLPAPTTASAYLTPAVRAQEQLRWRPSVDLGAVPLRHVLQNGGVPGLTHVGLRAGQALGVQGQLRLQPKSLNRATLAALRMRLDDAGLRALTLTVDQPLGSAEAWDSYLDLTRQLGAEALICNPDAAVLPAVARQAQARHLRLALPARDQAEVDATLRAAQDLGPSIGLYVDLTAWRHAGLNPVRLVKQAASRLTVVRLTECGPDDEAWLRVVRDGRMAVVSFDVGEAEPSVVQGFEALCLKLAVDPTPPKP